MSTKSRMPHQNRKDAAPAQDAAPAPAPAQDAAPAPAPAQDAAPAPAPAQDAAPAPAPAQDAAPAPAPDVLTNDERTTFVNLATLRKGVDSSAKSLTDQEIELSKHLAEFMPILRAAFGIYKRSKNWNDEDRHMMIDAFPMFAGVDTAEDAIKAYLEAQDYGFSVTTATNMKRRVEHPSVLVGIGDGTIKPGWGDALISAYSDCITPAMVARAAQIRRCEIKTDTELNKLYLSGKSTDLAERSIRNAKRNPVLAKKQEEESTKFANMLADLESGELKVDESGKLVSSKTPAQDAAPAPAKTPAKTPAPAQDTAPAKTPAPAATKTDTFEMRAAAIKKMADDEKKAIRKAIEMKLPVYALAYAEWLAFGEQLLREMEAQRA